MKSITLPELNESLKALTPSQLILDVRTPKEFSEGHVPHAKNIPVDQVMNHLGELSKFSEILVYCKMGGRAYTACEILESLGLKNLSCVDEEGFPAWKEMGFPVE